MTAGGPASRPTSRGSGGARVIAPGAALGVLGSGQLGRMFTIAARRMGYRVHTLSPDEDTPTGQVADVEVTAAYDDLEALRAFAGRVDVVTFEFENIPTDAVAAIEELVPVRPSGAALHVAQQRAREKSFLAEHGIPTAPFARAASLDELWEGVTRLGTPAVIKTAAFGYDGKGQHKLTTAADVEQLWDAIGHQEAVVEKFISLQAEVSVIAARGLDGEVATYPVFENRHHNHILDVTTAPAAVPPAMARQAIEITRTILDSLQYIGILCVEFFVSTDNELLVNELAPRPHNSGHLTFDAAVTSQFEQQVRAVCGLPLGSTELLRPAAMANLLGDLWAEGEPNWAAACRNPDVKLHLYGKHTPRPGRKMGHLTAMARTVDEAMDRVLSARDALLI
ncbi:MAG TPA: 5-(carboxyamino)imidazole ribonucleotide synthase [Vicinamibacterales bacterium]|nr:5-(carboxyamino)imidazole ribonucleotide synthase [Vicinamibacterales bacterium]